jgi:hypothetical protein
MLTRGADGVAVETNQFQSMLAVEFQRLTREAGIQMPVWSIVNTENKMASSAESK